MVSPEEENVVFKGADVRVLKSVQVFLAVQHLPFQMSPLGRTPGKINKGDEVAESST